MLVLIISLIVPGGLHLLVVSLCVLRPSSGFFAAAGGRSVRAGRRTAAIVALRAPTGHPSWVAASRRCPPTATAPAAPPPGSAPYLACPRSPRTPGRRQQGEERTDWLWPDKKMTPAPLRTPTPSLTGGAFINTQVSHGQPQRLTWESGQSSCQMCQAKYDLDPETVLMLQTWWDVYSFLGSFLFHCQNKPTKFAVLFEFKLVIIYLYLGQFKHKKQTICFTCSGRFFFCFLYFGNVLSRNELKCSF